MPTSVAGAWLRVVLLFAVDQMERVNEFDRQDRVGGTKTNETQLGSLASFLIPPRFAFFRLERADDILLRPFSLPACLPPPAGTRILFFCKCLHLVCQ